MKPADRTAGIAKSLLPVSGQDVFPEFFLAVLLELAKGSPISRDALADVLDWPASRVAATLEHAPSTEYDSDGNIVGYGLTLRETPHVFEIDGRRLYAWCALDTLIFPVLIGKTARVLSRCAGTGTPISLTVGPDGVRNVEPAEAAVSLVRLDASPDLRRSFCCHVHFFACPSAAGGWLSQHDGGEVLAVEDAFRVGQELARWLPGTRGK